MNYDIDQLWEQGEQEAGFDSIFVTVKEGQQTPIVLLPPIEFEGEATLFKKVENVFRKPGQAPTVSDQFTMRVVVVEPQKGGKVSFENSTVKAIQLSRTMFNELIKMRKAGYNLGTEEAHVLVISHDGKRRSLTPTPKSVTIPPEVLELNQTQLQWEEIIETHKRMQKPKDAETADELTKDVPW